MTLRALDDVENDALLNANDWNAISQPGLARAAFPAGSCELQSFLIFLLDMFSGH
jgi:hypothetical protein